MSQFRSYARFFLESVLMEQPCHIAVKVQLAKDLVQNRLWANGILNEPKLRNFLLKFGVIFHIFMTVSISIRLTFVLKK